MSNLTPIKDLIPGINMNRLQEYNLELDPKTINDYRQFNDFYYSGRHLAGFLVGELEDHQEVSKLLENKVLLDFGASYGHLYGWIAKKYNIKGYVGIEPNSFNALFSNLNTLIPKIGVPASIIPNDMLTAVEALPKDLTAAFVFSGVGSEIVGSDYQRDVTEALAPKAGKGSIIINYACDIYGYRVSGFKFKEVDFQLYVGTKD